MKKSMVTRLRETSFGLDRYSGVYLWAAIVIVFSVWEPSLFPTLATVHSVASGEAVVSILGLAVLIPLAAGLYDLSVGSTINFSCIVVTVLQTSHGFGIAPSVLIALGLGVLIGVVNGLLVVRAHIDSFIATLGMATIIGAFQSIVSGDSQPLPPSSTTWADLTQRQVLGFQVVVFYVIAIALVLWWVLERTPVGRFLFATGGNKEAARLSGVRTGQWSFLSLVASSTLASLGGVLYASFVGPSLTFGPAMLLPAFAAAFLGSTQFRAGRFNVWGTLLAVYVLATGVKGLQLVTGVQWLSDMFNGVALVLAVGLATWRRRANVARRTVAAGKQSANPEPPTDVVSSAAVRAAG